MEDERPEPDSTSPAPQVERRGPRDRRGADRRVRTEPTDVERRSGEDRRAGPERRVRRNINQYDLSEDVLEFIRAIQAFKERTGRPFPTWSDVLGILRDLGYEKRE
jgi:hypothetical protein